LSPVSFTTDGAVARIELDRPDKANALDAATFAGLRDACERLDADPALRVGVLSGRGRHFCAGIDLQFLGGLHAELAGLAPVEIEDRLVEVIGGLQRAVGALERCRKPVIAAVHGACLGGGLELIAACDLRHASADARFALKEVDLAVVADLGGLYEDSARLRLGVGALAIQLAGRSPRTLQGIKATLGRARSPTTSTSSRAAARGFSCPAIPSRPSPPLASGVLRVIPIRCDGPPVIEAAHLRPSRVRRALGAASPSD